MTGIGTRININVTTARQWLNGLENPRSNLGPSAQMVLFDMEQALATGDLAGAWSLEKRLLEVCDAMGNAKECAEARVACACVVINLGDYDRAIELLSEALRQFLPNDHQLSIVFWMKGCVLWQVAGRENDAIASWRQSIQTFEAILRNTRFLSGTSRAAYPRWVTAMREDMATANRFPLSRRLFITT